MKHRILVVEDEPAIVDNIAYVLETEGFEPICCDTIAAAEAALAARSPALVILDVGLPDGSGFELCKAIRRSSTLPVIFLTARGSELDRVVGLEIGADDYVVKPFSPRELAARVKAILRRSLDVPAPAASGPFQVDAARHTIRFHGTALALTRYEFRILEILLRHPGWVYSREQLMQLAWGEPGSSLDRSVDAHIKTLRAKLRAVAPDSDPIRTHRGEGYSLKEDP